MHRVLLLLVTLVGLAWPAADAAGQARAAVGPRVGFDVANVEELLLGADARLTLGSRAVAVQAALDVYLPANGSFATLSANVLYRFPAAAPSVRPYAGSGIGVSFFDDATGRNQSDTGLNLVGGFRFPSSAPLTPFVQAQLTLGSVDLIAVSGGLLFPL